MCATASANAHWLCSSLRSRQRDLRSHAHRNLGRRLRSSEPRRAGGSGSSRISASTARARGPRPGRSQAGCDVWRIARRWSCGRYSGDNAESCRPSGAKRRILALNHRHLLRGSCATIVICSDSDSGIAFLANVCALGPDERPLHLGPFDRPREGPFRRATARRSAGMHEGWSHRFGIRSPSELFRIGGYFVSLRY